MFSSVTLLFQASLCLSDPPPLPFFCPSLLSEDTVSERLPPASLQQWDRMPHWLQILTSVLKTRLELVWQMDFTCCWKTQACPTPCTRHTQALFSILPSPTQGAGNRDLPRGAICSRQHLCWALVVTSVEKNSALDELLERSVWSPPSSPLVITGLLGSRGYICVCRLSGLICINWKSVTGS